MVSLQVVIAITLLSGTSVAKDQVFLSASAAKNTVVVRQSGANDGNTPATVPASESESKFEFGVGDAAVFDTDVIPDEESIDSVDESQDAAESREADNIAQHGDDTSKIGDSEDTSNAEFSEDESQEETEVGGRSGSNEESYGSMRVSSDETTSEAEPESLLHVQLGDIPANDGGSQTAVGVSVSDSGIQEVVDDMSDFVGLGQEAAETESSQVSGRDGLDDVASSGSALADGGEENEIEELASFLQIRAQGNYDGSHVEGSFDMDTNADDSDSDNTQDGSEGAVGDGAQSQSEAVADDFSGNSQDSDETLDGQDDEETLAASDDTSSDLEPPQDVNEHMAAAAESEEVEDSISDIPSYGVIPSDERDDLSGTENVLPLKEEAAPVGKYDDINSEEKVRDVSSSATESASAVPKVAQTQELRKSRQNTKAAGKQPAKKTLPVVQHRPLFRQMDVSELRQRILANSAFKEKVRTMCQAFRSLPKCEEASTEILFCQLLRNAKPEAAAQLCQGVPINPNEHLALNITKKVSFPAMSARLRLQSTSSEDDLVNEMSHDLEINFARIWS